ncbi:hypothetical protein AGMMS49992_32040 [Clostridia bacterium]|nr:hypothetical protein AGMMS49992_32040 [Clostridia bacterium]
MAQWDEKVRTVNLFCDEVDRYVIEDQDWLEYDYATTINQTITITTPKALSEKEMSRELRNLNRQLALEY